MIIGGVCSSIAHSGCLFATSSLHINLLRDFWPRKYVYNKLNFETDGRLNLSKRLRTPDCDLQINLKISCPPAPTPRAREQNSSEWSQEGTRNRNRCISKSCSLSAQPFFPLLESGHVDQRLSESVANNARPEERSIPLEDNLYHSIMHPCHDSQCMFSCQFRLTNYTNLSIQDFK